MSDALIERENLSTSDYQPQYHLRYVLTSRHPQITTDEMDEHMMRCCAWGKGDTQKALDDINYLHPITMSVLIAEAEWLAKQPYVNEDCPREGYGDGN